jgi:DNA processing protein
MKNWPDKRCAWLGLYLVPGLGNTGCKKLLEKFGDPEAIFAASPSELSKVDGVREATANRIFNREFAFSPEEELKRLETCGARLITYGDEGYPAALREIHDPPVLLYAKGQELPSEHLFIAVVGSRTASHYGLRSAEKIGIGLARRGVHVVSGLARGIDSAAHWGCIRGDGFTIAVLGTGIDIIYPPSNRRLFEEVEARGALLSEFPMGTAPEPRNFPIRNRIISGLSKGVVVVEATRRSGSLITAAMALDQGRDVFAVPGSIDSFKSTGTHFLIKQGAKLVENADDILDELALEPLPRSLAQENGSVVDVDMDASEKSVYEIIGDYPIHIDQIVRLSDRDAGEILAVLTRLELKGIITQLPGKMFVR